MVNATRTAGEARPFAAWPPVWPTGRSLGNPGPLWMVLDEVTSYAACHHSLAEGQDGFADENELTAARLRELGISDVVYHRDHPAPVLFDRVRFLGLDVLADDGTVIAGRVP